VCNFLGLNSAELEPDLEAESRIFATHSTSNTPADTVARWRHELSGEEARIATAELRSFIEQFGYDPE
jgi:hypothetical protein